MEAIRGVAMIVTLERFSYSDTETEGVLTVGNLRLATIEQPWVANPNGARGGKPSKSCIPDGVYTLRPWKRPDDGDDDHAEEDVWIIVNPELGVYKLPRDHEPGRGRNLCLIHKANFARHVRGCIAPGLHRQPMHDKKASRTVQAVQSSRKAMAKLRDMLGLENWHILSITSVTGAS